MPTAKAQTTEADSAAAPLPEGWKEKLSRGDGGVHTKLIDAATAVAVSAT